MFFVWILGAVGLLLIFLEFFLPGAVMAVGGGLLLLASLYFFHMENPSALLFFAYLIGLAGLVYGVIRLAMWSVKKKIRSAADQEGFTAVSYPIEMIGKIGSAVTDLRPSGHIVIDGKSFQAVAKTGYINKNCPVEVLSGEGSHLIVNEVNL